MDRYQQNATRSLIYVEIPRERTEMLPSHGCTGRYSFESTTGRSSLSFSPRSPPTTLAALVMFSITTYYTGSTCSGTPTLVDAEIDKSDSSSSSSSSCVNETCTNASDGGMMSTTCSTEYLERAREAFGSSQYIVQVFSTSSECSTSVASVIGLRATGACESGSEFYYMAHLDDDGSAVVDIFSNADCTSSLSSSSGSSSSSSGKQPVPARAPKGILNTGDCIPTDSNSAYVGGNYYAWYTSSVNSGGSGSSVAAASTPGLSTGAIVGITIGCIITAILLVLVAVFYKRRVKGKHEHLGPSTLPSEDAASLQVAINGQAGLWSDDVITAKRIPRNRIKLKKLISRGAYGEVYVGRFYRQVVAIKMLLPGTRSSIHHVNQFLSEAKMTASMDHPHIVSFVGVSWDSLSDLCVVLEFMDGGDLRTLLDKYQASGQAPGFNKQKAAIALHICHGLTYLHSLSPPVIHRDLKSRNILLNRAMDAKLTDFGISRERLDQTMTAGVGTSLWMAPEVMLGERYDVMADMFSFGVVLAELDAHTLPYAQAKQRSMDTDGRLMTDAMLLQKITSGDLHVEFSNQNPQSLVELGKACVAVDPDDRPSAAEALYRLQVIAAQELAK